MSNAHRRRRLGVGILNTAVANSHTGPLAPLPVRAASKAGSITPALSYEERRVLSESGTAIANERERPQRIARLN
jgi:hypothetical protein